MALFGIAAVRRRLKRMGSITQNRRGEGFTRPSVLMRFHSIKKVVVADVFQR